MKKPVIYICTLVLAFAAAACSVTNALKMLKKASKTELAPKGFGVKTIPFQLINNKIIVPIHIGAPADKTVNFILDTGAPTILAKDFAEKNNIPLNPVSDKTAVSTPGGGYKTNTVKFNFASHISLDMSGLNISKPNLLVADLGPLGNNKCVQIDGILGSDVLSLFGLYIDFSRHELTLYENGAKPAGTAGYPYKLKLFTNLYEKATSAFINPGDGNEYITTWDLGYNGNILVQYGKKHEKEFEKLQGTHKGLLKYAVAGALADVSGVHDAAGEIFYMKADTLKTGKGEYAVTPSSYAAFRYNANAAEDQANVGIGFMKNYKIFISWKDKYVYLKPDSASPAWKSNPLPIFNAKYSAANNAITITSVNTASQAWSDGMRPGSQILKADGRPAEYFTSQITPCNSDSVISALISKSTILDIKNEGDYRNRQVHVK